MEMGAEGEGILGADRGVMLTVALSEEAPAGLVDGRRPGIDGVGSKGMVGCLGVGCAGREGNREPMEEEGKIAETVVLPWLEGKEGWKTLAWGCGAAAPPNCAGNACWVAAANG